MTIRATETSKQNEHYRRPALGGFGTRGKRTVNNFDRMCPHSLSNHISAIVALVSKIIAMLSFPLRALSAVEQCIEHILAAVIHRGAK